MTNKRSSNRASTSHAQERQQEGPERIVLELPDAKQLMDLPKSNASGKNVMNGSSGVGHGLPPRDNGYELAIDLNEVTRRQLEEDIHAYRYDMDFCQERVMTFELSASEARAMQLRMLDLSHQIRHCQHRIELIDAQARHRSGRTVFPVVQHFERAPRRLSVSANGSGGGGGGAAAAAGSSSTGVKRQRTSKNQASRGDGGGSDSESGMAAGRRGGSVDIEMDSSVMTPDMSMSGPNGHVKRLGFWKCNLCHASKYLSAGSGRVPSAPCKWPLKDVSKMMNHYLDMHTEHDPDERCVELGKALAANRGAFEYWLTRTHGQPLGDGSIIDVCIDTLQQGQVPDALKTINKAAAVFPNTESSMRTNIMLKREERGEGANTSLGAEDSS